MTNQVFPNRAAAGRALARSLTHYAGRDDVLVLALPRGGVPVGYELARTLVVPLDVLVVRKLGVPGHEELAMGAVGPGGMRVVNEDVVRRLGIASSILDQAAQREGQVVERQARAFRGNRPPLDLQGRTIILVDDGLATGASMRAAVQALRHEGIERLVLALPVAPPEACEAMRGTAEEVICLVTPDVFGSVGSWYEDFSQTSDDEVRELLRLAEHELGSGSRRE